MYFRKTPEDLDCGLVIANKILGGKWKPCIIDAISRGNHRPSQIHKALPGAPARVIDLQLSELFMAGVVKKIPGQGFPLCTCYELTDMGASLLPVIKVLDEWGSKHKNLIQATMVL